MPVSDVELGLVMVKAREVVPFTGMVNAPKDFVIAGGDSTVRMAVLLVVPVPPSVDVTAPVVLLYAPAVALVTSTETVHVPLDEIEPPLKLSDVAPDAGPGENAPLPQPMVDTPELATKRPEGNVSVKPTPVSDTEFELVMVKVSEVVLFTGMELGENDLLMVGGPTTVSVAVLLVVPVPPSVDVTSPVVLLKTPARLPVTFTEKEHELLDPMVPALRLTDPVAAVAVMTPLPQLPVMPGGLATKRPEGKLSVKATPQSDVVEFGLVIVKVSVEVPFTRMLAGANDLVMVAGATMVTVSEFEEVVATPAPAADQVIPIVPEVLAVGLTFTSTVSVG